MKNLFILIAIIITGVYHVCGQQKSNNEEVEYVIFTSSNENSEIKEGMYKYTSKTKSDTHISPTICFRFYSKSRNIYGYADCHKYDLEELSKYRKVSEKDKLGIKENSIEFLNSVNLIDMDVLFPKMTKEEFSKIWNSLYLKTVYFIDRSEIKNKKIKLYPVKTNGINQY